jgi:hypothetical protein
VVEWVRQKRLEACDSPRLPVREIKGQVTALMRVSQVLLHQGSEEKEAITLPLAGHLTDVLHHPLHHIPC